MVRAKQNKSVPLQCSCDSEVLPTESQAVSSGDTHGNGNGHVPEIAAKEGVEECQGQGCTARIRPNGRYYQTECGSFCRDCMIDHVHDCDSCARRFQECVPTGY